MSLAAGDAGPRRERPRWLGEPDNNKNNNNNDNTNNDNNDNNNDDYDNNDDNDNYDYNNNNNDNIMFNTADNIIHDSTWKWWAY